MLGLIEEKDKKELLGLPILKYKENKLGFSLELVLCLYIYYGACLYCNETL